MIKTTRNKNLSGWSFWDSSGSKVKKMIHHWFFTLETPREYCDVVLYIKQIRNSYNK